MNSTDDNKKTNTLNTSTKYTMDDMRRVETILQKRLAAIQTIINGGSIADAANILGKSKPATAAFISRMINFTDIPVKQRKKSKELIKYLPIWPENLYCDIFNVQEYNDIPIDAEQSADYVLSLLAERETKIMRKHYQESVEIPEIAEEYGVRRTRINQIRSKALRKLRHPSRARYLIDGLAVCKHNDILQKNEMMAIATEKAKIREAESNAKIQEFLQKSEYNLNNDTKSEQINTLLDEYIDILCLSLRSYNCLIRSKITTIRDITNKTESELRLIRNLGETSLQEIKKALDSIGLSLATQDK